MDTPMTAARKSFLLSLVFHTLIGSLAFIALFQMRTPPSMVKIPLQHMSLVSLNDSAPIPKTEEVVSPKPDITTPMPIKPLKSQPIPSAKALNSKPSPVQTAPSQTLSSVQTVSAPPSIQPSVQNVPVSEAVQIPSKPKIDIAAEKRAFFASLRSTIQNHLRYPSAARRRGMEGEVGVRFSLANNGTINAISIQRGEEIFHNSVKTAVASASGINVPKNLADSLPMEIELILEFKLNS
jgi:protein TonB